MSKIIEFDKKCEACKGSGIYVGLVEHDGIGVVCSRCEGKGVQHVHIEYEPFRHRTTRNDVTRVIETNPGIMCGNGPNCSVEDFGGMTYEAWLDKIPFMPGMEMRKYTCPAWWYQCTEFGEKPSWRECEVGSFSRCSHFGDKEKCWARWDIEHGVEV